MNMFLNSADVNGIKFQQFSSGFICFNLESRIESVEREKLES